jgi:hypothetical protein
MEPGDFINRMAIDRSQSPSSGHTNRAIAFINATLNENSECVGVEDTLTCNKAGDGERQGRRRQPHRQ